MKGIISVFALAFLATGCTRSTGLHSVEPKDSSNQEKLAQLPNLNGLFPTPKPISCESAASLGHLAQIQLQARFQGVTTRFSLMSEKEVARHFVDTDAKGNRVHYAVPAGTSPSDPWSEKDFTADKIPGTSTEKARDLEFAKGAKPVVVAVIDSGMDLTHDSLSPQAWTREDGSHGWNFLGAANGTGVYHTTLEVTREVRRMRALQASRPLTADEQAYLTLVEGDYDKGLAAVKLTLNMRNEDRDNLKTALETLQKQCAIADSDIENPNIIAEVESTDSAVTHAKAVALQYLSKGSTLEWFKDSIDSLNVSVDYYYNLDFDSSSIVGDHPNQMDEIGYGNPNISPEDADEVHATHVAGIIGAIKNPSNQMVGQAENVRILSLRAIPDGDERDKDIGNALRFAVDHGAKIINMSFGKSYSPNREWVWKNLKYAESMGVLIVHSAGNDALDNDTHIAYPSRVVRNEKGEALSTISTMIEVGASTRTADQNLAAEFSDYGKTSVDLFAPGEKILSTVPNQGYAEFSGTSMAAPEVTGIAALVLSQHPELSAWELKKLLLESTESFADTNVILPGSTVSPPALVLFSTLSATGGIVNAYNALKRAAALY
jgi:subtilisin family serine protease